MKRTVVSAVITCAISSALLISNAFGQATNKGFAEAFSQPQELKYKIDLETSEAKRAAFSNPAVLRFTEGCVDSNLRAERFSSDIARTEKVGYCKALQRVSDELNRHDWSPNLRAELQEIWNVFLEKDVVVRPMKKGVSSRVIAAAEAFTKTTGSGFNASLYIRPGSAKKASFFLVAMHELKHVHDYYRVWKKRNSITELDLERRAFKIMGKIARETPAKESLWRLPKVWDEDWRNLSDAEIAMRTDRNIRRFMKNSRFYKHLVRTPNRYVYGYTSNSLAQTEVKKANIGKGERLPYLVKTRNSAVEIEQNVQDISFETAKARDVTDADEILAAALQNERKLHFQMDNFVYDQNLSLKCWKKQRVRESYIHRKQIARTGQGEALFENERITFNSKKKKAKTPSCVLDVGSINSDATETFWSAPYLDQMPVKFNYFTELDGVKVARYTVYKPSPARFDKIAAKYPHIKSFRVFFGTIFVSVEDSQIIKFWGSSFPEAKTTGHKSNEALASYNATAVREKLASGIWVTTLLNTVAVANKKGKMKPFSYVVKYENYRQGVSDVLILDDEDTVAG